jgi:phosphorylcholine metabolism protein LicD
MELPDSKDILELYQLMKDIHELFEKYKIQYWVDGGTILGAYRHSGIIPWDDDLDISVLDSQKNLKFIKSKIFKNELKKLGYGIIKKSFGFTIYLLNGLKIEILNKWRNHVYDYKLAHPEVKGRDKLLKAAKNSYNKNDTSIKYHKFKYPFLDIFLTEEYDNKMIYSQDKNQWWSDNCFYNMDDLLNLKLYKFGKLKVYGAKNPVNYFNSCYGKDWNKYAYKHFDHKKIKTLKKKKFKIKDSDRHPAKPISPLLNKVSYKKK